MQGNAVTMQAQTVRIVHCKRKKQYSSLVLFCARSGKEDQFAGLKDLFPEYSSAFATNYKVKFIPSPKIIGPQYGSVLSGPAVFSRFSMRKADRYALPGNYKWPRRIFFLDRCMLVARLPAGEDREWVIVNTHNAAYDKGGFIKTEQLELIKSFALNEYAKGNAVIIGGDWNSYMPGTTGAQFPSAEGIPEYYQPLPSDWEIPGWDWGFDPSVPTCRSLAAPYKAGETFSCVIDGFLVSPNIEIIHTEGIDTGFQYSDHNPLIMTVKLRV